MKVQAVIGKQGGDMGARAFRRRFVCRQDHEIIGKPHQMKPGGRDAFIDRIQIEIGQQRRDRGALRQTEPAPPAGLTRRIIAIQPETDQVDQTGVPGRLSQAIKQTVMRDTIEEPGDVGIQHPVETLIPQALDPGNGGANPTARPIAMA